MHESGDGRSPGSLALDTVEGCAREDCAGPGRSGPSGPKRRSGSGRRPMLRVRDYVVAHADELSETISRDNGKTRVDAISTEVLPAAIAANYYARHGQRFLRTRAPVACHPGDGEQTQPRAAGAVGRDRHHLALELPVRHSLLRSRHGVAGRQRRDAEGGHPDADGRVGAGAVFCGGRVARRRVRVRQSAGPTRRRRAAGVRASTRSSSPARWRSASS